MNRAEINFGGPSDPFWDDGSEHLSPFLFRFNEPDGDKFGGLSDPFWDDGSDYLLPFRFLLEELFIGDFGAGRSA